VLFEVRAPFSFIPFKAHYKLYTQFVSIVKLDTTILLVTFNYDWIGKKSSEAHFRHSRENGNPLFLIGFL
jgi:hypothetical protein